MPRYNTGPPMQNGTGSFIDDLFSAILDSQQGYQGQNMQRQARMAASLGEDAKLRQALGSKRKRSKYDKTQEGTYVPVKYSGFESALMDAESGFAPRGFSTHFESEDEAEKRRRQQEEWAGQQRKMLGMPFVPRGDAGAGLWDRMRNNRRGLR